MILKRLKEVKEPQRGKGSVFVRAIQELARPYTALSSRVPSVNSSIDDHEGQNEIEFYRTLLDFDPEIFEISTISRSFNDLTYGTSIMRHQIRA